MNCLCTTDVKLQIVPQCSSCAQHSASGNRFMNCHHNPVFVPHGARAKIDIIDNKPDQATHEIQFLRKVLLHMKKQTAEEVVKEEISNTGVTVTGHRADELMDELKSFPNTYQMKKRISLRCVR